MGSISFLESLGPGPIYDSVFSLTQWILVHITPILITIAVYIRVIETQLDAYSGQSRYLLAVKDFLFFGAICTLYFGLGNLMTYLLNALYAFFETRGSYAVITQQLTEFIGRVEDIDRGDSALDVVKQFSLDILTKPAELVAYSIYYLTFLLASFVQTFMQLALALGFGFAFAWGAIAIPLAMTINFKLLKGWGLLMGGVALWPIVESLFMAMISPVFAKATEDFISTGGLSSVADSADIYTLYSILNLIVVVIHIAVPLVTGAIVANSSAMNSLVMPFAAGAIAATAATFKASKEGGLLAAKGGGAALKGGANLAQNAPEVMKNTAANVFPAPQREGLFNAATQPTSGMDAVRQAIGKKIHPAPSVGASTPSRAPSSSPSSAGNSKEADGYLSKDGVAAPGAGYESVSKKSSAASSPAHKTSTEGSKAADHYLGSSSEETKKTGGYDSVSKPSNAPSVAPSKASMGSNDKAADGYLSKGEKAVPKSSIMKSSAGKAAAMSSLANSDNPITPSSPTAPAQPAASAEESTAKKSSKPRVRGAGDARKAHFINKAQTPKGSSK